MTHNELWLFLVDGISADVPFSWTLLPKVLLGGEADDSKDSQTTSATL